ncbi:metallophosphoesterase family protein [Methylobacterium oxalidis]|uniref:metallophosphoesterase n=1 Tax=Methylobacterium oxalidis TaxID=944322 RepID=UPI003314B0A1
MTKIPPNLARPVVPRRLPRGLCAGPVPEGCDAASPRRLAADAAAASALGTVGTARASNPEATEFPRPAPVLPPPDGVAIQALRRRGGLVRRSRPAAEAVPRGRERGRESLGTSPLTAPPPAPALETPPRGRPGPLPARPPLPVGPGHAGRAPETARGPGGGGTPAGMRLWILSDLRVDRVPYELPHPLPEFDALLVAGDVCTGIEAALAWLARALDGRQGSRPVVMVPGNAEYWSDVPMVEALARGRALARELGLHLLSDACVRLDDGHGRGVHVVGATLWTDWALHGPARARLARGYARHHWPDARRIRLRAGRDWSPPDAAGAHARSRAYLEDALGSIAYQEVGFRATATSVVTGVARGDRAVVLTHHAPSRRSLAADWPGWLGDEWVAAALVSDLEPLMSGWGAPSLWVHGHVPSRADYRLGRTRVVANPRGDPARAATFDPGFVVAV